MALQCKAQAGACMNRDGIRMLWARGVASEQNTGWAAVTLTAAALTYECILPILFSHIKGVAEQGIMK
jgi:hypothetical protein